MEQAINLLTVLDKHLKISNQDSENGTSHWCVQHSSNRYQEPRLSGTYFALALEAAESLDRVIGIENRYRLKDLGSTRPDRSRGLPILLHNGYRISVLEVWRPGRGVDRPPSCSAEVEEN
jgi:hypothetical protein